MENNFDERFILVEGDSDGIIQDEHLIRYELAKSFVRDKKVLDIACGSGYGSNILSMAGAKSVCGVDISYAAVENARKKFTNNNLIYKTGDAENLTDLESDFDLAVSFETIEHLKNPEKFLDGIKKALKNDGLFLVSTPNFEVSGNKNPYHVKEYTRTEFDSLLRRYFKNVDILNQENAIASMITVSGDYPVKLMKSESLKPSYFIAICSDIELPVVDENIVSVNFKALEAVCNNPGFKLVNKLYAFLIKIPGIKKLFKFIAKK